MGGPAQRKLEDVYPVYRSVLEPEQWDWTLAACGENCGPETFYGAETAR